MVHCNKVTVTVTRYQDSNKVIALYSDSATLRGLCQVRPRLSEPLLVRMIKTFLGNYFFGKTNSFQASCQPKFGLHYLHNLHHLHVPLLRSHWCVRSTGVGRCKTRQDGIFIQIGAFLFRAIQRKTTNSVCQDCGDYHFEKNPEKIFCDDQTPALTQVKIEINSDHKKSPRSLCKHWMWGQGRHLWVLFIVGLHWEQRMRKTSAQIM